MIKYRQSYKRATTEAMDRTIIVNWATNGACEKSEELRYIEDRFAG